MRRKSKIMVFQLEKLSLEGKNVLDKMVSSLLLMTSDWEKLSPYTAEIFIFTTVMNIPENSMKS